MHISGKQQAVTYPAIIPPGTGRKAGIHFIQRISNQLLLQADSLFFLFGRHHGRSELSV